jgi:hypothetical protein
MKQFLHDGKGKPSHTRLLVILCVPLLVLVPLVAAAVLSFMKGEPMRIDPTIPLYLTTANGLILGYAVHNKREETKTTGAPATPAS